MTGICTKRTFCFKSMLPWLLDQLYHSKDTTFVCQNITRTKHFQLQTHSARHVSTSEAFLPVQRKTSLSSSEDSLGPRICRWKHSQNYNSEASMPLAFVNRSDDYKKSSKKQTSDIKIPVIARSRTKKLTRLEIQEKKSLQNAWLCTAFSTAEEYHLEHLSLDLQSEGSFTPIVMPQDAKDVLLMEVTSSDPDHKNKPDIFFFREGSVVFWNVPKTTLKKVLQTISNHELRPYDAALVIWENEHMNFMYDSQGPTVAEDAFILDANADMETTMLQKFAFSNAMALSVKLGIWESSVDKFTESLESIPEGLKHGRRLTMSRVKVMRKTGELFSLRHQINLSSDLLISPDFYWDRDDLDLLYNKTCQFYSIGRRTRVTNEKLNHCSELVELMRTHLNERHSLKLEWMIIILIAVEVMFEVIHYIRRYYEGNHPVMAIETASGNNTVACSRRR